MDDFADYGNYESWLSANVISMWDYLYRQREPTGCPGDSRRLSHRRMVGNCQPIEAIVETVTMDDFADYGNYESWLSANVISMWDYLYRQREPTGCPGDYQGVYPIGFPIGEFEP